MDIGYWLLVIGYWLFVPIPYIIYIVNFILAVLILRTEQVSDSDKSAVITAGLYVLLLVINFVLGIVGQLDRSAWGKYFLRSGVGLILIVIVYMMIPEAV